MIMGCESVVASFHPRFIRDMVERGCRLIVMIIIRSQYQLETCEIRFNLEKFKESAVERCEYEISFKLCMFIIVLL